MTMLRIDLNCDMGEGVGDDAAIMPFVTSANIACGAHAGDDVTMRATLLLALEHDVSVGAHPGYPDRESFGRRRMEMSASAIRATVAQQISVLHAHAAAVGARLAHVKPHGALYNVAAVDPDVARAVIDAVRDIDADLAVYGLAGSLFISLAEQAGLRAIGEAFADRSYEADGTLTPRDVAGAVHTDPVVAAEQVRRIVTAGRVKCRTGEEIELNAQTICVHGDTPGAVGIARDVRRVLDASGIVTGAP